VKFGENWRKGIVDLYHGEKKYTQSFLKKIYTQARTSMLGGIAITYVTETSRREAAIRRLGVTYVTESGRGRGRATCPGPRPQPQAAKRPSVSRRRTPRACPCRAARGLTSPRCRQPVGPAGARGTGSPAPQSSLHSLGSRSLAWSFLGRRGRSPFGAHA